MSKKIQLSDHFTYGRLLRFVMPSILMILCTSVYTIVDGFFVSNYVGKTAFAALNLVWPVLMAVSTIGFLIGTGGCALVSKTLGEGNRERANQYFSMLITVTFIGTVILSAIGFLLTPQIVTLLGAKGAEMQANSILYGRILFVGIPFMVLQQTFLSFYVAAEKPSLSLKISILAGVINMILDYVLIVPLDMGSTCNDSLAGSWRYFSSYLFSAEKQQSAPPAISIPDALESPLDCLCKWFFRNGFQLVC